MNSAYNFDFASTSDAEELCLIKKREENKQSLCDYKRFLVLHMGFFDTKTNKIQTERKRNQQSVTNCGI